MKKFLNNSTSVKHVSSSIPDKPAYEKTTSEDPKETDEMKKGASLVSANPELLDCSNLAKPEVSEKGIPSGYRSFDYTADGDCLTCSHGKICKLREEKIDLEAKVKGITTSKEISIQVVCNCYEVKARVTYK